MEKTPDNFKSLIVSIERTDDNDYRVSVKATQVDGGTPCDISIVMPTLDKAALTLGQIMGNLDLDL